MKDVSVHEGVLVPKKKQEEKRLMKLPNGQTIRVSICPMCETPKTSPCGMCAKCGYGFS